MKDYFVSYVIQNINPKQCSAIHVFNQVVIKTEVIKNEKDIQKLRDIIRETFHKKLSDDFVITILNYIPIEVV